MFIVLNAGADIIQGLSDSVPAALALFFSTTIGIISGILKIVDMLKKRDEKAYTSIKPVAPAEPAQPPSNPFGTPPSTGQFAALQSDAQAFESLMATAKWRESSLRRALDEANAEAEEKARSLVTTREELAQAEMRLRAKNAQLATLQDAVDRITVERDEALRMLAELQDRAPTGRPPRR